MDKLPESVIVIGSIVAAIMVLTIFFRVISWIGRKLEKSPTQVSLKGILNKRTPATVHLANGMIFENVRQTGWTDTSSAKGYFPYEFGQHGDP